MAPPRTRLWERPQGSCGSLFFVWTFLGPSKKRRWRQHRFLRWLRGRRLQLRKGAQRLLCSKRASPSTPIRGNVRRHGQSSQSLQGGLIESLQVRETVLHIGGRIAPDVAPAFGGLHVRSKASFAQVGGTEVGENVVTLFIRGVDPRLDFWARSRWGLQWRRQVATDGLL